MVAVYSAELFAGSYAGSIHFVDKRKGSQAGNCLTANIGINDKNDFAGRQIQVFSESFGEFFKPTEMVRL
jgi:hypothetical protein